MDPIIEALPGVRATPEELLGEFRERLARTGWAAEAPDSLLLPMVTSDRSLARFEALLRALFRAHLKVLRVVRAGGEATPASQRYAELAAHIRQRHLDWPVLGPDRRRLPDEWLLSESAADLLYGRPDVVIAGDGPKVVDTGFDTAVAGFERPDDLWTITAGLLRLPAGLGGRPLDGLRDYFGELPGADGRSAGHRSVHWVLRDDPKVRERFDALTSALNDNPDGVRHLAHYPGDRVPPLPPGAPGYLHRACSIHSVQQDRARFAELFSALAPRMVGCTVPLELSQLSSGLYSAWLSDPAARPAALTAGERQAVRLLLPWSRPVTLLDPADLTQLHSHRTEFVLKRADAPQSGELRFGRHHSAAEWAALLEEARAEPVGGSAGPPPTVWIVQQRVHARQFEITSAAGGSPSGTAPRRAGLSCRPYLMGGRIRTMETWLTPGEPDPPRSAHRQFVAHYIRPTPTTRPAGLSAWTPR
ncbi:hypothetical protein ACIGXM_30025 [Kitasatospora sp. NPDC052896]|uniref:hypothetical protein n=1 Tax=Kitasatospora sp. NPDC052896 TaxID=3364061 RepID=UPI0037C742EA